MNSLIIDWCSYKAAKYAVEHWHYSRKMPVSKLNHFGVWEDGEFIGIVMFGPGATRQLVSPYGLMPEEGCELVRIAMKNHKAFVTEIVAFCIKKLKQFNTELRLIVSFADPSVGHSGKIYQAGNWIYSGKTQSIYVYYDKRGREYHPRNVHNYEGVDRFGVTIHNKDNMVRKEKRTGKHRYLYPLDKAMRRKILKIAQPYPQAEEVSKVICSTSS